MGEKRNYGIIDEPPRVCCQGPEPFFSPTLAAYPEQGASLVLIISNPRKVKMEKKGTLLKLPLQQHVGKTALLVPLGVVPGKSL